MVSQPGVGVVAGAMIAVEQRQAARQGVAGGVGELGGGFALAHPDQHGVMRDRAERQHDFQLR